MSDPAGEPDPRVLGPGRAPTPFTADEIRRGCPQGRTILLRVDRPSEPPAYRSNHFVRCDDAGADIARAAVDADGAPLGDQDVEHSTWHELQEHASFPADRTEIVAEDLDSRMGVLRCLRYEVADEERRDTFWFAQGIAGMPVKVVTRTPDGQVTGTVTMIANQLP